MVFPDIIKNWCHNIGTRSNLVTLAQVNMTDTKEPKGIIAAVQSSHVQTEMQVIEIVCYKCSILITWPRTACRDMQRKPLVNHTNFAEWCNVFDIISLSMSSLSVRQILQDFLISVSLLPQEEKNEILLTINLIVNERKCTAFMHTLVVCIHWLEDFMYYS